MINEWLLVGGGAAAIGGLIFMRNRETNKGKTNTMSLPGAATVVLALFETGASEPSSLEKFIKMNNRKAALDRDVIENVLRNGAGEIFTESGGLYDLAPGFREQMSPRKAVSKPESL